MKPAGDDTVIGPARPDDEPAIRALLRAAGLPDEDFAAHLAHFLVARRGATVVGAAGFELHGADALLRSLVVAPAQRGGGLGGRLVQGLSAAARRAGVQRFYLLTTTAEVFFSGLGFEKANRADAPQGIAASLEFRSLCPASAVCMTKILS